jgi:hypothetical protein
MKLFVSLLFLLAFPVWPQVGDAFTDPRYKKVSPISLSPEELTGEHLYESDPCGSLMSEFIERGSVRVGRGPVYAEATLQCQRKNPDLDPNEFSFRTFACRN